MNFETKTESDELAACFDQYFVRVYNYIRLRVGDATLADDLTATVFEKALSARVRFDPQRGSFQAWIFKIAHNTLNNHYRSIRPNLPLENQPLRDQLPLPEETVMQRQRDLTLLLAVQQLDERERTLIALKYGAQLSNRQIAKMLHLRADHVGTLLYRALKHLRSVLMEMDV